METNSVDEQNLAKALGTVDDAVASLTTPSDQTTPGGLAFEETSTTSGAQPSAPVAPAPSVASLHASASGSTVPASIPVLSTKDSAALEAIKKNALVELRPLVGKLTSITPEERFDTYLLIIRSTDDTDLIAPAHEAAKEIADETRRAEALLDIIKEIDYLSQQKKD